MEANICDVNRLDSDVHLPPRKRLLACMKKYNCDVNGNSYLPPTSSSLNELDARLRTLLRVHLSNENPSQMEVVEASRSAAEVAVRIAVAARAAADEKAAIAAEAMAAAKNALELAATLDDETFSSTEQQLKKNKRKKHVHVQLSYDNWKPRDENGNAELARELHQAINSSPRISKYGMSLNSKNHKQKRLKRSSIPENGRIDAEGDSCSVSNANIITHEMVAYIGEVDENMLDMSRMDNRDAEGIQTKAKFGEQDTSSHGRKRGRMKLRKLPLGMYHDRDKASTKEDHRSRVSEFVEENTRKTTSAKIKPLFSVGPSADRDDH